MAAARHKHVLQGATARSGRVLRYGVPAAVVLTMATVTAGVVSAGERADSPPAITLGAAEVRTLPIPARIAPISRSEDRVRLEAKPPAVTGQMFATATVNIRAFPREDSRRVGSLEFAEKIAVSGLTRGPWVEVVLGDRAFWAHGDFLSETRPEPDVEETSGPDATGVADGSCPTSAVESGLVPNAVAVHRAVCNVFPQITSYGGLRPGDGGEHGSGRALDVMVSGPLGWQVAEYVRANAGDLGVSEVLYAQKIWTVERGSEGWRPMPDMGSTTANHYDHVHVTVY